MEQKNKKRIGILRGGSGEHYQSSLNRGGDFIAHIAEHLADKYKTFDILVDKDGVWHYSGVPINPDGLLNKVDVVWNTTHPSLGNILNSLSIPNVSQESFSSALQNSREMLREHMKSIDVSIPRAIVLPVYQKDFDGPKERYSIKKAMEVFEKFGSPWVVKPVWTDASRGRSFSPDKNMAIHLAKTFPELVNAIEDLTAQAGGVNHEQSILVEEFITGKVASVHSVVGFRGEDLYTFPPVNVFGDFSLNEKEKLVSLTKDLHRHIGAGHYLKSNFLLNPRGKVYLLDFESTPNLKPHSHFAQACESVGLKMHHILDHIIERVL